MGDNDNLFYTSESEFKEKNNTLYLDSGCSNPMTGNKKLFLDVGTTTAPKLELDNGQLFNGEETQVWLLKLKKETSIYIIFCLSRRRS